MIFKPIIEVPLGKEGLEGLLGKFDFRSRRKGISSWISVYGPINRGDRTSTFFFNEARLDSKGISVDRADFGLPKGIEDLAITHTSGLHRIVQSEEGLYLSFPKLHNGFVVNKDNKNKAEIRVMHNDLDLVAEITAPNFGFTFETNVNPGEANYMRGIIVPCCFIFGKSNGVNFAGPGHIEFIYEAKIIPNKVRWEWYQQYDSHKSKPQWHSYSTKVVDLTQDVPRVIDQRTVLSSPRRILSSSNTFEDPRISKVLSSHPSFGPGISIRDRLVEDYSGCPALHETAEPPETFYDKAKCFQKTVELIPAAVCSIFKR